MIKRRHAAADRRERSMGIRSGRERRGQTASRCGRFDRDDRQAVLAATTAVLDGCAISGVVHTDPGLARRV